MSDQPLPTPEEIQRKLSEFMNKEFGDRVVFAGAPQPETLDTTPPTEEPRRRKVEFDFNLKPKDVRHISTGTSFNRKTPRRRSPLPFATTTTTSRPPSKATNCAIT